MRPIDADELEKSLENYSNNHGLINAFVEFLNVVDELPTLDVRPIVRGYWIDESDRESLYTCSVCREKSLGRFHKYCPHCGAMMAWGYTEFKEYH